MDAPKTKKERRPKRGRPSSMGLSEEGPLVSCIDTDPGNRSTFFIGALSKKKRRNKTPIPTRATFWDLKGLRVCT